MEQREDLRAIVSPDVRRENRVPPGQRLVQKWPVLHDGEVPSIDETSWTFRIFGLVEKEVILTLDQFRALPMVKVRSDIHCVTGWSMRDMIWEGIGTEHIRRLAKVSSRARHVMVYAAGGFTTNLPLVDFFQEDVLFAHRVNDEDLSVEHGHPLRLVVPRLYFWKSAKWANGVEFMEESRPGFWESRGYHMHGDPWKEERYGGQ